MMAGLFRIVICAAAVCLMSNTAVRSQHALPGDPHVYLKALQEVIWPERPQTGRVSPLDATWADWLARTGELPPDFSALPSLPFLPDPLVLDEGGAGIPVTTPAQWAEKRAWIAREMQHWVTGTVPPPPGNVTAETLSERKDGEVTVRLVRLRFGPGHKAALRVELLIPPGEGPFPVFLTQWNHRVWATVAVRRGYIGAVYAGADALDDSEDFWDLYYPDYDFTRLMRRAWAGSRAIDYFWTLPQVDREKIALTGHSRNGKQSLMLAAFDDRVAAVIPSSGLTGSVIPWRYTSDRFDTESIEDITTRFPHWLHPRLRFFIGQEHKLPVDQNLLMALVAPRFLMLTSAITEHQGNPWAMEQSYLNVRKVYEFLGAEDRLAVRLRHGLHGTAARDIEDFLDFFDYAFGRTDHEPPRRIYYRYAFSKWLGLSGETVDPLQYPRQPDAWRTPAGRPVASVAEWEQVKPAVRQSIGWGLGDMPPVTTSPTPPSLAEHRRDHSDYLNDVIGRPAAGNGMGAQTLGYYNAFGQYVYSYLYYPADANGNPPQAPVPAVVFLHEYAYATGFGRRIDDLFRMCVDRGLAVLAFDFVGFGSRIEEGERFYERYPHWSKLGSMVADTRAAVGAAGDLDIVDGDRVYTLGYALGGTVGLYAAALDDRIAGAAVLSGVHPLRAATIRKGTEGLQMFSHLHGLQPRLGFFVGYEDRVPWDFQDLMACVAPRPLLVIAPRWDRDAPVEDVRACAEAAQRIYALHGQPGRFDVRTPEDFSHFPQNRRQEMAEWLQEQAYR